MKKEIGSVFPLSESINGENKSIDLIDNCCTLSLCREALSLIAQKDMKLPKVVLLPAYTCATVIDPFKQEGWECHYYGITLDLHIDSDSFMSLMDRINPTLVVCHPYFGMDLNDSDKRLLRLAHERDIVIVEDLTQSIFLDKKYDFVDYSVGSLRKWFPIPDGAFIFPQNDFDCAESENLTMTFWQKDAMYLRKKYFETNDSLLKEISIRLNKHAEKYIAESKITAHKMSVYSLEILAHQDFKSIQRKRIDNYAYLYDNLKDDFYSCFISKSLSELSSAPLYFPLYVEDNKKLQKELASHGIYAPILWPVKDSEVLVNPSVEYIYSHIIVIPIDQRYEIDDMKRICEVLRGRDCIHER